MLIAIGMLVESLSLMFLVFLLFLSEMSNSSDGERFLAVVEGDGTMMAVQV